MATNYKTFPVFVPVNGQNVWFRTSLNEWQPFKATYNASTQTFIEADSGISYPAYTCHSWKPV